MVLLLEDDPRRVQRFQKVLRGVMPGAETVVWDDARRMVAECAGLLPAATLISLDHDLESGEKGEDPGDGLMVAEYLITQETRRPVVVHTSNTDRGLRMIGTFQLAGWRNWRVLPVGEEWIETDWRTAVEEAIRR